MNKSRIETDDGIYSQKMYNFDSESLNQSVYPHHNRNMKHQGKVMFLPPALNSSFDVPLQHRELPHRKMSELDMDSYSMESEEPSQSRISKQTIKKSEMNYRKNNSMQSKFLLILIFDLPNILENYNTDKKTAYMRYDMNKSQANSPKFKKNLKLKMDALENKSAKIPNQKKASHRGKLKRSTRKSEMKQSAAEEPDDLELPDVVVNLKMDPEPTSPAFNPH